MANYITYELDLIKTFESILKRNGIIKACKNVTTNFGNNTKELADIEFLSIEDEYLIIEAKSHFSKDRHNTYHKLFGELLKEASKVNNARKRYKNQMYLGVLIPEDKVPTSKRLRNGYDFYKDNFNNIEEKTFKKFGLLVNAKYVFVCSEVNSTVKVYSWMDFYKGRSPLKIYG
ncbi:hypothetical protein ACLM5H_22110 [Fredinandcohnia humi]